MLDDEDWQNRYPEGYKHYYSLYRINVLGLFGMFLKRMRRHKNYPRRGCYAPVYDLMTNEIKTGLMFSVLDGEKVDIIFYDVGSKAINNRMVVNSILEAWMVYRNAIYEEICNVCE